VLTVAAPPATSTRAKPESVRSGAPPSPASGGDAKSSTECGHCAVPPWAARRAAILAPSAQLTRTLSVASGGDDSRERRRAPGARSAASIAAAERPAASTSSWSYRKVW
jgi:hypothetical protein